MLDKLFGGISSLKLSAYFIVLIAALVGYHALAVAKLELGTSKAEKHAQELSTSLETTKGQLQSEKQQRQATLTELARWKAETRKWKKAYEVDTAICKTLYSSAQVEADRRKLNAQKLEEYSKKTPAAKKALDSDFTKLLNGE